MDNKKHVDNILKIIIFHNLKCKAYPLERINTSKGVIRNRELSLVTLVEKNAALGKQGVANYIRIIIKRATNTYNLTFNKPTIQK